MQNRKSGTGDNLPSNYLCCHKCKQSLIPFQWMCLCKHGNATHCTLKYDHQIRYDSNSLYQFHEKDNVALLARLDIQPPSKKKTLHTLHCKNCSEKVATAIKIMHEFTTDDQKLVQLNEAFVCFRPEATYVEGLELPSATKCAKWPNRQLSFDMYEDLATYFRIAPPNDTTSINSAKEPPFVQTYLPNLSNDDDGGLKFNPPTLLKSTPRDYQIEMYYQSLFTNSEVCLPTGLGKTLVSVMLIKKMCEFNPEKLVAFVVNKIPLAYQQSEYFSKETGQPSVVLCSQTRTVEAMEMLRNRNTQVGFFTDGLLLNLLDEKIFRPEDFCLVVFDEIHHGISSNSKYNIIAQRFLESQTGIKITGLTASPIDFTQLEISFKIDTVSYPYITRKSMQAISNPATTKIKKTSIGSEQTIMVGKLKNEIYWLNEKLNEYKIDNLWNYGGFQTVVGYLRKFSNQLYLDIAAKMLKLIPLIEITEILGTKETFEFIRSDSALTYLLDGLSDIKASYSERFGALESILNKTSEEARILVFVKTKEMSFRLTRMLQRKFQKFYPKRIVGQHGVGGMNYENEQKLLIDEFKSKECKLLVSTSVLEEGIDISDCNLVVLFDGSLTLRRVIQARGRARKENSTFFLLLGDEEKQYYDKIELEEKEMIKTISLRSETSSNKIKSVLEHYFIYRETIKPVVTKILSFTVHHFTTTTANDIKLTMQDLKRNFEIMEWDKQSTHIELTLEESEFENFRKNAFNAILNNHSVFIEPTESIHNFNSGVTEYIRGALEFSAVDGFQFHVVDNYYSTLDEFTVFHNNILRAVGNYLLLDENSGQYIVNVCNSESGVNTFSYLGNCGNNSVIPEIFKEFKVYYVKLYVHHKVGAVSMTDEDSTISYFLSYIQDQYPMVYITPHIIEKLKEGLQSLNTAPDNFSENALSMSSYALNVCSALKRNTFASESKLMECIELLPKQKHHQSSKDRFIRCITYSGKKLIHELPQLVDDKRFFRKLGIENFIKVKIAKLSVPSEIVCCGKEYCPVGGSLSMLRSDYVYFFDKSKYESVYSIMNTFGTYSDHSFKLISRHALNFTTTTSTIPIDKWKCIPDIKAENDSIMTDGIGKISKSKAREISTQLGLGYIPTAFQIRILGFKGVLTVLPDEDLHQYDVIVRESMLKFEGNCEFNKLEIVSYTSPRRPAYLNRQIILLLLSLGISTNTFLSLFLDYFRELSNSITNPKYFLQILKENCMDTIPAVQSLNEMPDDEFLKNVARYLVYGSLKKVQNKAMIPVEKAVIAMSIVDEYQQLEGNEVMVQLGDGKYLDDGTKVFICRNPCVHPADIQLFTVRNNETLRNKYMKNNAAVIFPTKGYSATKVCDFDGDRVFVCWDTRLVPDHTSNLSSTPLDSFSQLITDHCHVLTQILENGSVLGKISDGWVAITDSEGAESNKALQLADLFVAAVDFPKTGVTITLPDWLTDVLYPDFMERKGDCIKSDSILGKIYQKCINIKTDLPLDFTEPDDILIENERVKKWNERFWQIVNYLKQVHSCTLFDLVAGDGIARKEFSQLIEQFREIAREENCHMLFQSLPISNIFSLIFPSRKVVEYSTFDLNKRLAKSLTNYVDSMPLDQLKLMEQRIEYFKRKIGGKFRIHIFGSLPILLHHSLRSDCDTYIDFDAKKGDDNPPSVCLLLASEFEASATDWQKSIPMFRLFVKENDLPFLESFDFTNSSRGLKKKHHLRLYMEQKPHIIIILKVLIQILRTTCPLIKTYQMVWKIIEFCVKRKYLRQVEPPTEQFAFHNEQEKDSTFMERILGKCLQADLTEESSLIIEFLRDLTLSQEMEFVDNLDGKITEVKMNQEQLAHSQDLLDTCLLNLHLLHDFSKLNITEKEEVQVYLPGLLMKVLGSSLTTRLKQELEKTCNCTIEKIIRTERGHYIMNASGEHGIGTRLKQKLALWNNNCKYFRANNQRLFLDGSTETIFEGDSFDTPIEFTPYKGISNPKHSLESIAKHLPKLKHFTETADIPRYRFYQKLISQILKVEALDLDMESIGYSIKFGTYYVINYEKSLFSEVAPQNSDHYNSIMKKNHFTNIETIKKKNQISENTEEFQLIDYETEVVRPRLVSQQKDSRINQKSLQSDPPKEKEKPKKAPSDSFLTMVDPIHIETLEKELQGYAKNLVIEYHVYIIENVEKRSSFEYKIKLNENMKLKLDRIMSYHTRILATTFVGKTNDMRFYINHSKYLPKEHTISKLVNTLNHKQWIIKQESPQQLSFHSDLPLVNVVRKVEKRIYTIEYSHQPIELTITKVTLFTKKLSSLGQVLDLSNEHYELKLSLQKSAKMYSPSSCMALLNCGIMYWNMINRKQE